MVLRFRLGELEAAGGSGFVIAVRLKGGLGNQLFQYAAARALAVRHGSGLGLDASWYNGPDNGRPVRRDCDLSAFRVAGEWLEPGRARALGLATTVDRRERLLARVACLLRGRRIWRYGGMGFAPEFARLGARVNLEGYFQHPTYFERVAGELVNELVLRTDPPGEVEAFAERLAAKPSVCVQVRRMDFVADAATARVHGCVSPGYYQRAWQRLLEAEPAAEGHVFTDDQVWARDFFRGWPRVEVVGPEWDGPAYLHRFHLMTRCRHFVVMNSTWGWWAAWLGARRGGRVILPDLWLAGRSTAELGLLLPGWQTAEAAET